MAEVYWIHLPEHTDVFSEGYVGITSKTTAERFKSHIKESKRRDRKKYRIHNVIAKYSELLVVDTLLVCSDDYAIEVEAKLRPSPKIGWNTVAGGQNVKLLRDIKGSPSHTEDSKAKMKLSQKKSWEVNKSSKLSALLSARKPLDRPVDNSGSPLKFWTSSRYKEVPSKAQWEMADKFYEFYSSVELCDSKTLMDEFSFPHHKKQWFQILLRYFDGGWNPLTDPLWLEDFKNKEVSYGP